MRPETPGGMRPPSINLARRPFRNNTAHYAVFGACAILLAAATFVNVREFFLRGSELTILKEQIALGGQRYDRLFQEVETMKREIAQVNLALLDDKSGFVNGLILSRSFSWSLLFDRLEDLIPYDVKVRSIRPAISPKEIEIQIDGMAKSYLDFYEFEANLGDSDFFAGVYPVGENMRESRTELNFDLIMKYLPGGKSARHPSAPTPTAGLPQPEEQEQEAPTETAEGEGEEEPAEGEAGDEDIADSGMEEPPSGEVTQTAPSGAPTDAVVQHALPPEAAAATPAQAWTPPAAGSPREAVEAATAGAPEGTLSETGGARRAEAGPIMKMPNKEFWDKRGEERFMAVRGALVPRDPDDQPGMTNAEYIKSFGLEQFMARRGSLTMIQQQVKPVPPVAP